MDTTASSIKSKERVQQHGEVFTSDSIVNDMLDLVDAELKTDDIKKYIDSTYLEPSCGTGNFLIRILDRKLEAVQLLPEDEQEEWLLHAVSSIYGVDIQKDNVLESRERMLKLIENGSVDVLDLPDRETQPWHFKGIKLSPVVRKVVEDILEHNILHGDCLTGHAYEGVIDTNANLVFIQYTWKDGKVNCSGHSLDDIKNNTPNDLLENYGRYVPYLQLSSLNLDYSDDAGTDF